MMLVTMIGRRSADKLWHCVGTDWAENIPEIMKLRCNKSNVFIDFNTLMCLSLKKFIHGMGWKLFSQWVPGHTTQLDLPGT